MVRSFHWNGRKSYGTGTSRRSAPSNRGIKHLEHLLKAVPYRIHTILTDNGIQFAEQPRNRNTAWSRQMRFDMICEANDIEHRLTKPNHPWTNGQVERMNRTIREATVKRFHYESHDQLRTHLADFMAADVSRRRCPRSY